MSRKYKQMDKHFQIYNARRIIKQEDIDYFSLIDSCLYFPENLEILIKEYKYDKYKML